MRNMKERQPMVEVSYIRISEEAKLIEQKKRLYIIKKDSETTKNMKARKNREPI